MHEITEKIVGERRIMALRDLGTRATNAKTAEEGCAIAAEALAKHAKDVPFSLIYLVDPDRQRARLAGSAGVVAGGAASPPVIDLNDESDHLAGHWPRRCALGRRPSRIWLVALAMRCRQGLGPIRPVKPSWCRSARTFRMS